MNHNTQIKEKRMKSIRMLLSGVAGLAALSLVVGCGGPSGTKGGTAGAKTDKGDHTHGAGPHGGAVGDWGGGKYHIEFTVDHDKQEATVYILDGSVKKAVPIKAKDGKISASIKGVQNKDAFELELMAAPQEGDPEGKASRFVGKHEKIGVVQEFEGTITGENEGTPYTGTFKEEAAK
jgi:hypothetical protein